MKPLFLIPARGGSKGVPGKNIRHLAAVPLISHSIRHAMAVAPARDIVVSTDSREIALIAEREGATVPFIRPEHLATDTAGSREVMLHAIDFLNAKGCNYDTIVLLQPTSPFRNIADIRGSLKLFEDKKPDMVVSVREAHTNPYYNAYEAADNGFLKISKGEGHITRRQDAPEVWEFDGSIYVINADALRKVSSLAAMEKILPFRSTVPYSVDIDTELDFIIAEHLISSGKMPMIENTGRRAD